MTSLPKRIVDAATAYYLDGSSPLTDDQFDSLVDELRRQDPTHWLLSSTGWGAEVIGDKAKHIVPVEGLDEIKYPTVPTAHQGSICTPKHDGISVFTYVVFGTIKMAITRGDHTEGVIVTDKLVHVIGDNGINAIKMSCRNIPLLVVRGEVVTRMEYKEYLLGRGIPNIRNFAAGLMNRKGDYSELFMLDYLVYTPIASVGVVLTQKLDFLNWFERIGFQTPLESSFTYGVGMDLKGRYEDLGKVYEVDGIVLTRPVIPSTVEDGVTIYHESSTKYKFPGDELDVVMTGVSWETGPSGRVAPTAEFEPTFLSGATLSRASAFNASTVRRMRLTKGTVITITRANDVIPYIVKMVGASDYADLPGACPSCGSIVSWKGEDLVCNDKDNCPAQTMQSIWHLLNIAGMPDGLGKTTFQKYLDQNYIEDIFGFIDYLRVDPFYEKEIRSAYGDHYGKLIYQALSNARKKVSLGVTNSEFWRITNIDKLGVSTSVAMGKCNPMLINRASDVRVALSGYKVQEPTKLAIEQRFSYWRRLAQGLPIAGPEKATEGAGIKVCVTGSLKCYKNRGKLIDLLNKVGVEAGDASVTSATDYLICNEPSTSSKYKKAESLPNCRIITEDDLFDILEGKGINIRSML